MGLCKIIRGSAAELIRENNRLKGQLAEEKSKVSTLTGVLIGFAEAVADKDGEEIITPVIDLYQEWEADTEYKIGDRRRHEEKLYACLQAHTSQAGWEPPAVPALWKKIAGEGEIPVWEQPTGAHDAYAKGDKVYYPDKQGDIWVSIVDANVWQPGVYGWEKEVAE